MSNLNSKRSFAFGNRFRFNAVELLLLQASVVGLSARYFCLRGCGFPVVDVTRRTGEVNNSTKLTRRSARCCRDARSPLLKVILPGSKALAPFCKRGRMRSQWSFLNVVVVRSTANTATTFQQRNSCDNLKVAVSMASCSTSTLQITGNRCTPSRTHPNVHIFIRQAPKKNKRHSIKTSDVTTADSPVPAAPYHANPKSVRQRHLQLQTKGNMTDGKPMWCNVQTESYTGEEGHLLRNWFKIK